MRGIVCREGVGESLDCIQAKKSISNDNVRETLQSFCARLAHDLNNLLTPLVAYPALIADELPPDSKALTLLRSLESTSEGVVAMTQRLSDLSGALRTSKRYFSVVETVDTVLAEMKMLPAAANVQIEMSDAVDSVVHMSQGALSLAVGELCRNALEALKGGGTLSVRVERQEYEAPFATVAGVGAAGTYAVIEIEDDGVGMSDALRRCAVEPFQAGFGGGKRCAGGLGLSIAYCALRENGASMILESEEGRGTMATLLIPDVMSTPSPDDQPLAEADAAARKTVQALGEIEDGVIPRVLVVDDEPSIANLFKLILENYIRGVAVDKAANGVEALAKFNAVRYDVIVMDLHMPVMDGQTAFLEIENMCRMNHWTMPSVIFCTGYAPRDVVKRAISEGERHTLLNKPVRSEVLVKAVQTRLERPSDEHR